MAYEELQKWYSDYLSRIVGKIRGGQELNDREFQAALSHIQGWRLEESSKRR